MKPPLIRQGEGPAAAFARIAEELERDQRKINRIVQDASTIPDEVGARRYRQKLPGDERALRGIPAIGRGVTGAIPGTRPGDVRESAA